MQVTWVFAVVVLALLLLVVLASTTVLVRYQRRQLHQHRRLRADRDQAQRQALRAALLAQEEERRRIAADLHDEVGTTLAIAKLHLSGLQRPEETQEIRQLLDQAIGEVRRISRNLMPAALQKFGLVFSLQALARAVPADHIPSVALNLQGEPAGLLPPQELAVYRIVQELLGNGLRHARATRLQLEVAFTSARVTITYTDNGIGFDPEQLERPSASDKATGLGITNMRSRVELLQGVLRHQSTTGAGTQIWISFPVPYLTTS